MLIIHDLSTNTVYEVLDPGIVTPGFIIPLKCKLDQFIVGNHLSTAKVRWNGIDPQVSIIQETFTVQAEFAKNNYLAGKDSPQCTFHSGTYRTGKAFEIGKGLYSKSTISILIVIFSLVT